MKKILSLVLALCMLLMVGAAFADDPAGDPPVAAQSPSGSRTLDASISVSGLETGDKVDFYQVLRWDDGWKTTTGFALTDAEVLEIAGRPAQGDQPAVTGAISWDMAQSLAEKASALTPTHANVEATNGTATVTGPAAGLYLAIIKTTASGVVYNPCFVAADYGISSPETSALDASVTSYSAESVAKKSSITLDKTMTGQTHNNDEKVETTNVGDTVSFKIDTKIPIFTADYTDPVFKVTDTLTAGLEINASSITLVKPVGAVKDTNYTITPKTDGFELSFDGDYLKTLGVITDVQITYTATVTNDAVVNINEDDNTVDLAYSTNPSDTTGAGRLRDKTKEYTFSIDARLLGSDSYDITELVKVGLDKDGNEITQTRPLDNGYSVGALQGATFELYKDEACTDKYTNTKIADPLTSDADGRINIKGLDGGVYYIKEISAPAGYIKDQNPHKIEIKTVFSEHTYNETVDGVPVTYKVTELDSYTIEVDGVQTASFAFSTNEGPHTHTDIVGEDANKGKIKNTQGTELPSTGGIGTTIFYILGGVLVVGAAIILVARRKAEDK
jgi:fimbrial isopeptide formation D2 family protein/LPXTG-motif cell wall-anchored protein